MFPTVANRCENGNTRRGICCMLTSVKSRVRSTLKSLSIITSKANVTSFEISEALTVASLALCNHHEMVCVSTNELVLIDTILF
jgi:hypothetical protein